MNGWEIYALGLLLLAFLVSRIEIAALKRRERQTLRSEAEIRAWTSLDAERKTVADERLRQAYARGLADAEKAAQGDIRVEYWTQTHRQQGYFFASKEVLAFTQLMYKDLPVGPPQRHVLEKSEAVDRPSIERMLSKILREEEKPTLDNPRQAELHLVRR